MWLLDKDIFIKGAIRVYQFVNQTDHHYIAIVAAKNLNKFWKGSNPHINTTD